MALVQSVLQDVVFEDGGLKSLPRIRAKTELFRSWGRTSINLPDVSRSRAVCKGLAALDAAYIQARALEQRGFSQVGHFNYYADAQTKYESPYRALHTHWASVKETGNDNVDALVTEVQFVTERVRALLDLNHAFDIAGSVAYPSEEHREWMHAVLLKASILDLEELG